MGKFKMGSGTPKARLSAPTSTLPSSFPVPSFSTPTTAPEVDYSVVQAMLEEHFAKQPKAEPQQPLATMVPTPVETRVVETVREISTLDSRARKHSMMLSKRIKELAKSVQKTDLPKPKPEQSLLPLIESLENKIACLEMLKPQEKHIVTKETVVRTEIPKIVYIGLGLSLALNVLALILAQLK